MATDTVTIGQFVADNGIALKAARTDRNPNMGADMDHWKVTLTRPEENVIVDGALSMTGRKLRMTVTFSKGRGHNGAEPTANEVLDCLASDAAGVESAGSFEDWCSEYGYDTDSRKAHKTFKACEHEATRLKNFLGDDLYDQLLWHTERE
jgi:hypothetical protein